jgi:hypothetical protein
LWPYYGGRGIRICQEWLDDLEVFVAYLANLPDSDDRRLWLDRIRNDGNYEPGNLRFVTPSESACNRRRAPFFSVSRLVAKQNTELGRYRAALGYTTADVATIAGVHASIVGRYENGLRYDARVKEAYDRLAAMGPSPALKML